MNLFNAVIVGCLLSISTQTWGCQPAKEIEYAKTEIQRYEQIKADVGYMTIQQQAFYDRHKLEVELYAECVRLVSESERERKKLASKPGVRLGMTPKQVATSTSWGKPEEINRTTTSHGTSEQWVYGNGNYLYFTNGKLSAIQN